MPLETWDGRPSLQFHEGLFFAPYTFRRPKRAPLRPKKEATSAFR